MCKCLDHYPSWKVLWGEMMDELIELKNSPLDPKEWSDVCRGVERFIEKFFGFRFKGFGLGGELNRKVQLERLEKWGCIRSERLVKANGGKCLSS
jgi:hypothetical protein